MKDLSEIDDEQAEVADFAEVSDGQTKGLVLSGSSCLLMSYAWSPPSFFNDIDSYTTQLLERRILNSSGHCMLVTL
jgi:hypothetical protein